MSAVRDIKPLGAVFFNRYLWAIFNIQGISRAWTKSQPFNIEPQQGTSVCNAVRYNNLCRAAYN